MVARDDSIGPDELRAWRAKYNVSRARLAALTRMSVRAVGTWEIGLSRPRPETERRLRRLLAGPPRGWKPAPPPPPKLVPPVTPAEIRRWRHAGGVSPCKLAQLLGVHVATLFNWEAGRRSPNDNQRARLHELLAGDPPSELLSEPKRRKPRRWERVAPQDITEWRRRRGISRNSLACLLRVSEATIFGWEKGRNVPGPAVQRRIEAVLRDRVIPNAPSRLIGAVPLAGGAIMAWREQRAWSRRQLAEALGVSEGAVAGWEHDKNHPRGATEARLRHLIEGGQRSLDENRSVPWKLLTARELRGLLRDRGRPFVAHALGVEVASVRAWETGLRAPPYSIQRQLLALLKNANHGTCGSAAASAV